ncbi:sugar ABC transporter substrate-binding protein [Halolactibacillus alkaliphilus]|uniref:Sugar ABC transporter substrate-binding protein n=1 Tax=Halolactibacillus alkaliphilus TaxID=442899 RepID=A0A511WZP2_9BACI|nr:extracellular solute-binding protein [Halolactibacillus alkaliphilus]GEN56166.1 sugar ABC transporter substrate-binding protein [Halolactibacillus alkaliphilus]GGN66801.1 sugar ABC transporter substrate-binding protein [Halolactibacillus alkaliphilus]SFO72130.1 carbohydrate ABC transporter substrate-binding protein, CUT1 family (TC 3.A.1.1.-) [Halolactibacillus alkaliphilus]
MKKKTLTLLFSLVLASLLLMACGGEETSSDEGTTPADDTNEEVITLRMMGYNPESSRAQYLAYLDEQLPNINVEFEFVALDNFNNVLNSQLQAGEGPDIIEVGGEAKLLARANYLLDLTDHDFMSKYAASGTAPYSVDGGVYAAPLQSWFEGFFYNKAIFEEYGVDVPRSLDQLIAISHELKDQGMKPQAMGAQSWEPMMKQSIGIVNNEFYSDEANMAFNDDFNEGEAFLAEAWLPYVEQWYRLIEEGILTQEMLGLSYDQALDDFATGKAAMWQSGPWAIETIYEKNSDIELGMFPIPGIEEGPGWLIGGPGSALAINANSKHIDEALAVLELTATEEAQHKLVADNAGSSFLTGVEVDLGDVYADSEEAFALGNVYAPWTASWFSGNPIVESYGKSLQEVLSGTKTVEEALKDADETNKTLINTLN